MEVTRDGVRLVYDESGDGPDAAVLLHGMACNRGHMGPVAEHLSGRYRCINIDLRGHGDSDAPASGYSMDDFVADLQHVILALDLGRPLVVGHSFGGSVALAYAATYPDTRAAAIVMLDSGMRSSAAIRADLGPFYDTLHSASDAGYRSILDQFVRDRLVDALDGPTHIDRVAADMSRCPRHVFLATSETVQRLDSARSAARCPVPALLVRSRHDFVDRDVLDALGPTWHVGQVVGAGHFVQLVVPEQVCAMIDRFLAVN